MEKNTETTIYIYIYTQSVSGFIQLIQGIDGVREASGKGNGNYKVDGS